VTEYVFPQTIAETVDTLDQYAGAAQIIAGGTDLLPDMRRKRHSPLCLVDISRVPALSEIEILDETVTVGAAVTFSRLKAHPVFKERVPALASAAGSVGAWAIQTVATWAGNIVQAMPGADGAIVALALEVEARVVDHRGEWWVPVERLFAGAGVSAIDSSRQLVSHLRFRLPPLAGGGTGWQRMGRRGSLELPVLNCAAKVCLNLAGQFEQVTIGLGPVAPRPYRAREAELFLLGKAATQAILAEAGEVARSESNPRSSAARASRAYRLEVIPVLVADTLTMAVQRAKATFPQTTPAKE